MTKHFALINQNNQIEFKFKLIKLNLNIFKDNLLF